MSREVQAKPSATPSATPSAFAAVAVAAGAVVAVVLGVYGAAHTPSGEAITTLGFSSMIAMKVWLAVAAGVLALAQLVTAAWMYGRLGGRAPAPRYVGPVHRATGALAVLLSLPVAYHCLWALGFQSYDTRTLVHSVAGCLLYGALVTKLLVLHGRPTPGWLLPAAGGAVFTLLVLVVLTSAVWYLSSVGMPSSTGY